MNIKHFSFGELFSNSQGKTSMSLVCACLLVITGCFMGIKGSFTLHTESLLQGVLFAGMGTGLLTVRRYTKDKEIPNDVKAEDNPA